MATAKIRTSDDIINGLAVVGGGVAKPQTYDNTQRTQHYPSGDSLLVLQNINSRYKYHGGTSGSGNWEH
jgi:hypothetical protein